MDCDVQLAPSSHPWKAEEKNLYGEKSAKNSDGEKSAKILMVKTPQVCRWTTSRQDGGATVAPRLPQHAQVLDHSHRQGKDIMDSLISVSIMV